MSTREERRQAFTTEQEAFRKYRSTPWWRIAARRRLRQEWERAADQYERLHVGLVR